MLLKIGIMPIDNARLLLERACPEGDSMIPGMKRIEKEIKAISSSPIKEVIDIDAKHNEIAWRKRFPEFYNWTVLGIGNDNYTK
jgi:hypothetical protein